jgi:hypothetical protein
MEGLIIILNQKNAEKLLELQQRYKNFPNVTLNSLGNLFLAEVLEFGELESLIEYSFDTDRKRKYIRKV